MSSVNLNWSLFLLPLLYYHLLGLPIRYSSTDFRWCLLLLLQYLIFESHFSVYKHIIKSSCNIHFYEVDTIIPILQMKELRLIESK